MMRQAHRQRARSEPPHRWVRALIGGGLLVGAGIAVGWAVTSVLTPASDVLDAAGFTTVVVVPGEVGSSLTLNTAAQWEPVPVGTNRASGVVTGVSVAAGDQVDQGDWLYVVDLRPVVVAEGQVPAFREVGAGARGEDVAQLQVMLGAVGFYDGDATGEVDEGTEEAIRAWQESLGLEPTGVVMDGDVIFVPSLPTRVALDVHLVSRGSGLSGGEAVLQGLPPAPTFTVPVTETQAQLMPLGTRVEVTGPGEVVWEGFVADQVADEFGSVTVSLEGTGGAVICGQECGLVPVTGQSLLTSRIVTVETVFGLVVPSAALVTGADGVIAVVEADGVRRAVSVVASARGMSVIEGEGVVEGLAVRVPASEES